MLCPAQQGGFLTLRHNEVRDVTASLLKRVTNNVAIEPHLQPVIGEQFRHRSTIKENQTRLDVAASGIWSGRFERTFIDVRVFNLYAPSNWSIPLATCYAKHEWGSVDVTSSGFSMLNSHHSSWQFSPQPAAWANTPKRFTTA